MIDIVALTEHDVGKWVTYRKGPRVNRGRIKGWDDRFVYVVYWVGYTEDWDRFKEYNAIATLPEDLDFDTLS